MEGARGEQEQKEKAAVREEGGEMGTDPDEGAELNFEGVHIPPLGHC